MPKIKNADISELIFDDKNFNTGSEFGSGLMQKSFERFGAGRGVLVDKNNRLIAGNKSTEIFGGNGGQKIIIVETEGDTLVVTKRTDIDLDSAQGREMALADNATAKANIVWADQMIIDTLGVEISSGWGVDIDADNGYDDGKGDYTKKIITPLYEPKNPKPAISDLYDSAKKNDLFLEIEKSDCSPEDKEFLKAAALRHIVFNYENIADYYAHSAKNVQKLMEDSALIIIDYDRAIELGYVKLSADVAAEFSKDYPDDEA